MKQAIFNVSKTRTTDPHPRRGFSLIEILVVLVVLLIGILAVLRLFPGGFLTIQRTGEIGNAQALVDQQIAGQRSLYSVADGIINAYPGTNIGEFVVDADVSPSDLTDVKPANFPAGADTGFDPDGYFSSNINHFRRIIGETLKVPVSARNGQTGAVGSVYLLQFGPIFNRVGGSANAGFVSDLNLYGAAMTRTVQSAAINTGIGNGANTINLTNDTQYAIDYAPFKRGTEATANPHIAFPPRLASPNRPAPLNKRTYQIRFTKTTPSATAGPSISTSSVSIDVPDVDPNSLPVGETPQPIWQPIPINTDPNSTTQISIVADSDDVSRKFRLVQMESGSAVPPPFTDDPYEYAFLNDPEPNNANAGSLMFNPAGRVSILDTNSADTGASAYVNQQPLIARADYFIFDNHVIRDVRAVPQSGPYIVKLSLPFIAVNGDVLADGSTFTGIFRDPLDISPDIAIYDEDTGEELTEVQNGQVETGTNKLGATLDAKSGTLTLQVRPDSNYRGIEADPQFPQYADLRGHNLRINYRTQKDWGLQVQKAYARYQQAQNADGTPNFAGVDYQSYAVGDGNNGTSRTRLYFRLCDAGKTVSVGTYYYRTAKQAATEPAKRVTNQSLRISDNPNDYLTIGGVRYTSLDIKDADSDAIGFDSTLTGRAVSNVQGLSLKSRVAWRSGERYRRVESETILEPTVH